MARGLSAPRHHQPSGNEAAAAAYLAHILHSEGVSTRLLVTPEGRTNLFARLPASRPASEAVVLLHHMDVVAAGVGWTHDPFGAEISKKRMWGRGAIDAKSLGIAHLAAFIEAKRANRPRTHDLIFLAVADEETGGRQGVGWILDEHADLFSNGVAAVLNEGGSNRVIGDRLLWWGVEVSQKRPLWLRVSTQGRGGHGSAYNPRSASHRLIAGLAGLLATAPEYRVTEAARDYFEAIAPFHGQAFRDVFVAPSLEEVRRGFADLLANEHSPPVLLPGMLAYFQDTVQVTSIETSSATVNVVPEEISALIDLRLLPDTRTDDALASLRERLGPSATIEVLLSSPVHSPVTSRHGGFAGPWKRHLARKRPWCRRSSPGPRTRATSANAGYRPTASRPSFSAAKRRAASTGLTRASRCASSTKA